MSKPRKTKQNHDSKIPVFLRLAPSVYHVLMKDVETGRYGNIQEKIYEILRRETELSKAA